MASKKQTYDVIVPEDYTSGDGEIKTRYHTVGVAFENKASGMDVILPPGIALSGRFTILPRRAAKGSGEEA